MTEEQFQKEAEAEAARLGLLWHHCTQPHRCRGPRGFPDMLALGPGGWLSAELKSAHGETSPGQDLWAWTAYSAGLAIPVFRPGGRDALFAALRAIA